MVDKARKVVALLPMKAHSARVPRKNFRPFHGKPLVRWILDTLLTVDRIDQVVINSDALQELREIGIFDSDRIIVRERRTELCGDHVSMNLVISDDILAVPAERYVMTHTTNPLLSAQTINAALDAFEHCGSRHDSLFTVNRLQTRFYRADGSPINHDPTRLIPTQELEPWYEENSSLYVFTADSFRKTGARIGQRPMLFETPKIESADIDTEHDWALAEALARGLFTRGRV